MEDRKRLTRFAWLSIGTAVLTISLKVVAYFLTGSVGLLSDALESGVNLVAALLALAALTIAAQPPDEQHAYGHAKAEYFSSGAEGTMILFAAVMIAATAIPRLLNPQPLEQVGVGLIVSIIAAVLNLATATVLTRAGKQYNSITLTADAHHLLSDVWTSAGVVVGVAAVALTGWNILDPLIALAVAAQILYAGVKLVRKSAAGLMDTALPAEEIALLTAVLDNYRQQESIEYHALRTRQSASQRFLSVHIQVPGDWTVQHGHTLLENIERDLRQALRPLSIITHLEPIEDPASWQDIVLNREE
ncbi:MAG: cation transporter [Ardenticatenaceae bacterium]|nr:cation transporter [Anaerolineales bacterium]MCB8984355.1 cation transporter [Ardenticatenaceae bacterium]MCB8987595.1 cation transporter [Ardenticatenaceae bacterium]